VSPRRGVPSGVNLLLGVALVASSRCGQGEPSKAQAGADAEARSLGPDRRAALTKIEIVAGERRWTARIDATPAARDFLAQLPLELTLKDFAGNEKIADLPHPLTRKDAPDAITPHVGDIAFYAPWGNLAIFYRDGHHSPGLIPLGRIDGEAVGLAGSQPVKVSIRRTTIDSSDKQCRKTHEERLTESSFGELKADEAGGEMEEGL
jgi:hypothetical protein